MAAVGAQIQECDSEIQRLLKVWDPEDPAGVGTPA